MMLRRATHYRSATAAIEAALMFPILITFLVGLWEAGRIIHLQQVLSNAAREGARMAAQSQTINSTGTPTQIQVSTGSPNVKTTVVNALKQGNVNLTSAQVTVEFAFTSGDTTKTQPFQGVKGQQFQLTVRIPTATLMWSTLSIAGVTEMSSTVKWACLVDDPFTLDTTMPSW